MTKALLFAGIAALGNALFAYGQRGANPANPLLFMFGAGATCTLLFGVGVVVYGSGGGGVSSDYLAANYKNILISGVGFFVTFLGFFLLYSRLGASYYIVYAVLAIITTSIGVGVLVFREPFNVYHVLALLMAIISILLYGYGHSRA